MASLYDCRWFSRAFATDDISKTARGKQIKFQRAFQFLQLLLVQRVYRLDLITCSAIRRSLKYQQREQELEQQENYQVFLGGSCNPTTWRRDQAIPYFQSRSVSFYNPQVSDWTPDLVEIEHRAKTLAPLLFFVIDHDTRALASIVEVCYLASRGRSIIVVMSPMPDKNLTKFIQNKSTSNANDDENDYENVCDARRTLRQLLRSINIPVFDNVRLALECAASILETTKRTVANNYALNNHNNEGNDILTPLQSSPIDSTDSQSSSVVFIRSLSNKTAFNTPDEFYQQMRRSELDPSSSILAHRRHSATPESINHHFRCIPMCPKSQISCSANENEDDGYGSLSSSNRTLSGSSVSISSEFFECTIDHSRDDSLIGSQMTASFASINLMLSKCYSYLPIVSARSSSNSSMTQSLFVLFTLPFRFLKNTIFPPALPSLSTQLPVSSQEPILLDSSSPVLSSDTRFYHMFDLYVAAGKNDECWLNTIAFPILETNNITFTRRQSHHDNDQLESTYDIHVRRKSRVLFYLINGSERLSHLATELAFLIGERQHKIIVFLQSTIDEHTDAILSACERRDVQRSRQYLKDLANKEKIILSHSREQSWQHVLSFFHGDHQ